MEALIDVVPHWYMYPPKCSYVDGGPVSYDQMPTPHQCASIYVHIPFCNMKCSFCSLYTSAGYSEGTATKYVRYLVREIELFSKTFDFVRSPIIYFGGGTPALLSHHALEKIVNALGPIMVDGSRSQTVEFSPDVVTEEKASAWVQLGFNRVSLGVQSFNNERLATMRRHHDGHGSSQAISVLNAAGFKYVNVDLIFGGHGQTNEAWLFDIEQVLSSGVDSCTFHPLALISKTAFDRKLDQPQVNSRNLSAMHQIAIDAFQTAGWIKTSAISFSRSGTPNPLEQAEALGIDTIGFGAGSRSYVGKLHVSTLPANRRIAFGNVLHAYYDAVDRGEKPALSAVHLTDEEVARRRLILSLHHGMVSRQLIEGALSHEDTKHVRIALESELENLGDDIADEYLRMRDASAPYVAALGLALASQGVKSSVAEILRRFAP